MTEVINYEMKVTYREHGVVAEIELDNCHNVDCFSFLLTNIV